MKTSCNDCRALFTNSHGTHCKLGFEIDSIFYLDQHVEFYPLVPCPKPLTFDQYFTYLQEYENSDRNSS